MGTLRYIDPPECGCMDCLFGEARPLNTATHGDITKLSLGLLVNRTGMSFETGITVVVRFEDGTTFPRSEWSTEMITSIR